MEGRTWPPRPCWIALRRQLDYRDDGGNIMALACLCRKIDEDDFSDEAALKARVMQDDFVCGQCQLRYMASFDVWAPKPRQDDPA
jgi:hypothetical protein